MCQWNDNPISIDQWKYFEMQWLQSIKLFSVLVSNDNGY